MAFNTKYFNRVFTKLKQTHFKLRKGTLVILVSIFISTCLTQLYLLGSHKQDITKNIVKSQLNSVYETIQLKFDLGHMHIALDYNGTQTINDSAKSLKIPHTLGMSLEDKSGRVVYSEGDLINCPSGDFIAISNDDNVFIQVPIFTELMEYRFLIKLKNYYKAQISVYPGDYSPQISIPFLIDLPLVLGALYWASIFSLIIMLAIIIWSICVSYGTILHDQNQYRFLYKTLALKIDEIASKTIIGPKIKRITNIINFVSSLDRETASSNLSQETFDIVSFLNTLFEAYKYNFENIKFNSNFKSYSVKINRDALACIITNLMQNSVIHVSKIPPSLNPQISIDIFIEQDFIDIKISNTFIKEGAKYSEGLGTRSIFDICSNNNWNLKKVTNHKRYLTSIKIPRR